MPKQKLLLITASFLLIIGIIGSLITYKSSAVAGGDETKTEVIDNINITKIDVKTENARVDVLPTNDTNIKVEFTTSASDKNKYKLIVDESGDSLSIEVQEKLIKFLFFALDFDFKGPNVTVYLPEKQYDELMIDVVNGKINVESIVVDDASIETTNGRVELQELDTVTTTVSSENGSIKLDHVEGEITSDVVNGSTTFITEHLNRSIDLESVNGKIKVQTAEEPTNATIAVSVVNGKVDIFGSDSRSAVIGDGEHKVNLKTVNGSISVSK